MYTTEYDSLAGQGGFYSLDRFEEGQAVLLGDDGTTLIADGWELPAEAREGDILRLGEDGQFVVDREETDRRQQEVADLLRRILDREPEK